jgi:2-polyprenyl-3-methyl-5-hydroxy-6-metoxy-1,4-benzoquinol methylase
MENLFDKMFINTANRNTEPEMMDNFLIAGELHREALDKLAVINKWLGGNIITMNGLKNLLKNEAKGSTITITDFGCGGGEMLRIIADYGRKNNYLLKLTGIDANENTLDYARKLSTNYPEINFIKKDVLKEDFEELNFDIALSTLFLHHFTNEEIIGLLNKIVKKTRKGVIINDLHRSKMAYYLFKMICIFISNPMVKKDGFISIRRGFKKNELILLSNKIQDTASIIYWKWAFRYQWIIKVQ